MTAQDDSSRRLRVVDDQHEPDKTVDADEDLTAKQAAAFATLVASTDQAVLERTLDQMETKQLQALAVALAVQVNATETASGEVADVGPEAICAISLAAAVQSFGTTREAVLSGDRHRAVTDARAVAMTAARRGGLTLPAIATYFNKDHTSVMYAQSKVAGNPRLEAVCTRIVSQLEEHYVHPGRIPSDNLASPEGTRSTTLQLGALDQAREEETRRRHDDHGHRFTVSTAPAR